MSGKRTHRRIITAFPTVVLLALALFCTGYGCPTEKTAVREALPKQICANHICLKLSLCDDSVDQFGTDGQIIHYRSHKA